MTHLFKCTACGEYTLQESVCPRCGSAVATPDPPRYSPIDKYGKYRRMAKKRAQQSEQKGAPESG